MDVRLEDGTIVKNVPDTITKAELMRKLGRSPIQAGSERAAQASHAAPQGFEEFRGARDPQGFRISDVGPMTGENRTPMNLEESQALDIKKRTGHDIRGKFLQDPDLGRKILPLALATGGSFVVPGSGWGALAINSLAAGGGAAGGELMSQRIGREEMDLEKAAKSGAMTAAGNFAGGSVLKVLNKTASKLFSSPLDESATAAADFARSKGVPAPMTSLSPGSRAAMAQQLSRGLLPGEIRTQMDANRVAQFLNREVSTIQAAGSPIDEAAIKGQKFLRSVFEPGETVYTETFRGFREVVGDNAAIPLNNTSAVLAGVSNALKERGTTGGLAQQIQTLAKRSPSQLTAQQIDDLYSELLKKAARNPNARAEMNVVLSALTKDADDFGKQFGVNFMDDLTAAKKVRDQYRSLRNIPGLERLGKDFGEKGGTLGSRQWMSELFGNPNGKALAEFKARAPELYKELADSWMAENIKKFSRPTDSSIGSVLDGNGLRAWYEKNAKNLNAIYGDTAALDNFTNYAKHMSGAVNRANTGSRGLDPLVLMARGGGEAAALYNSPILMSIGEGGSYVLAKGLSDPNSTLFRLFTQGVKPSTMKFLEKSSELAGRETARGVER